MQVDRANADLKNTNVRLKQTILQVKFSPPMVLSLTDAWVVSWAYMYPFYNVIR
jgi:hypothetical protein